MLGIRLILIALVFSIGVARLAWAAPQTWELQPDGRWEQLKSASTQPVVEPALDQGEQLLAQDRSRAAKKVLLAWLKKHKDSPVRDRALYLFGEANFRYGDRIQSFYNFDELMDNFPESPYFQLALQRQYDIAEAFLNGYKRRFLGIHMFTAEDEAIEMLYRIQNRSPGSPLAERALLRTADYYYATDQFDLAVDSYAAYSRTYPRSPLSPRARLRQALSSLQQFRTERFDATTLVDAREQLISLQAAYPKLAAEENLSSILEWIEARFARKIYLTADFYRRTHAPKAAAYNYQYLIRTYPDSPEAKLAQEDLQKLPAWARETPAPPQGETDVPTATPTPNVLQ